MDPAMNSRRISSPTAAPSPSISPSNVSCGSSNPIAIQECQPSKANGPAVIKVEPLPASSNVSSPSSACATASNKEVMARRCSWCAALHTEQTAAIVTDEQCFCNELCFAQSRRARFKRSKGGIVTSPSVDDTATSTGVSRPLLSGPSSSGSSSIERTPSNSVSPRGALSERSPNGSYQRGSRHRFIPGPLGRVPAAPPCCGIQGTVGNGVDIMGTVFPGSPASQTVFVPVPLPIPIPIFKNAPELLEIMRRYNFRPSTPPPTAPQPPPAPLCVLPSLAGQSALLHPPRVTSDEDNDVVSSDETDGQALDLSLPKGLDADLRHLTEASYYKSRRQLILDKPYTKNTGTGHFNRRSFKAMRRK